MLQMTWWLWVLFIPGVVLAFVMEFKSRKDKAKEEENKP